MQSSLCCAVLVLPLRPAGRDQGNPNVTFKLCGSCHSSWENWESFIADPALRLLGLQALGSIPEASVLVFEHRCGSSVSVLTSRLLHLVANDDVAALPSLRGTPGCALHCFTLADHQKCDRACRHRQDRDALTLAMEGIAARRM